ncbi:MAG: hypothetical protein JNL90_11360 [Planctomycetes bacterium]|nr:hypothetical protein [Planctomycetota bacterium]
MRERNGGRWRRSTGISLGLLGVPALASIGTTAAAQATCVFELPSERLRDWFGRVEWIDDVDGDRFDDFLVGAPNTDVDLDGNGKIGADERKVGSAYLFSGRHLGAPLRAWHGAAAEDDFGSELARLGDIDRDGVEDFAIAAPSSSTDDHRAYVRVYSGRSLRDPDVPELIGEIEDLVDRDGRDGPDGSQGDFGAALAPAGDVNGDHHDDFLIAGAGRYRWTLLISGRTLAPLYTWDVNPGSTRKAGHSTAVASFRRDVDGDGQIDLAIGDYSWNNGPVAECGAVWIYSGLTSVPTRRLVGTKHHDWFGYAIHVVPDLSEDPAAKPELLIGAPGTYRNDFGLAENGNYVAMWFGETLGALPLLLPGSSVGAAPGSFFGAFIDSGDYLLDPPPGDRIKHELFVAARHHFEKRGLVSCFEFEASTPAWRPRWSIEGRAQNDKLGRISARGRLTTSLLEPDRPDAGDDLLVGTAHINDPAGGGELGHVWCFSAADGVDASSSIRGSGWAGDDLDPSLVPTIDLAAPPLLGTTARVRVACSLEPSTLGLLLVGLGDATTPETPHLLVSDYLVRPFVMNGVAGVIDVEVPADPALFATGKRYFAQAVLALPGVEGGIGYTPLVEAVVGGLDW